jgi:hypothetical protein
MPAAVPIVIVPRNRKLRGQMLADPAKLKTTPQLTRQLREARQYPTRQSAYKFLSRHPDLKRKFKYTRVAESTK